MSLAERSALTQRWRAAWPQALAVWSKFTQLRDPRLCQTKVEVAREGLSGSFAMIRLNDQSVVIDMAAVHAFALDDYAVEILAHEIGHHVLAPGSAADQFRLLARMRRALSTIERHAPMVANLYTDLYINDRLQRQANLRMGDIYTRLNGSSGKIDTKSKSDVWSLYMRIYEHLWKLDKNSLGSGAGNARLETDAWLGARLIRVYANEWLAGAGRFATLVLPYLAQDIESQRALGWLHDTKDAAAGSEPYGMQELEADEIDGAIHPAEDPLVSGLDDTDENVGDSKAASQQRTANAAGQLREPFEYGEILKAAGVKLSDHDIAVRYYRERALPHLLPFPRQASPESTEPQLEGLEPWDIGDALDELDWLQTVMQSPQPIPGLTTVRRQYGREPSRERDPLPVDLDMYVDSSGSMPNPQRQTSFLTLAGAVIALSALRAGSSVQATLWSGKTQVTHTGGFVRDEEKILRVLTGFYGGSTAFPIHRLRETYAGRAATARPVHILMISDDGINTMFDQDEMGNSGWDVSANALKVGRAGGTMALNVPDWWNHSQHTASDPPPFADLRRATLEQGWEIHAIARFEDLLEFARAFARRHYALNEAKRVERS